MPKYFVDLHVHIGATENNIPVKITASRKLTFKNILQECLSRKGIEIVGIVDCASPEVQKEIEGYIAAGTLKELPGGGLRYKDCLSFMMGVEIESRETNGGKGHFISYFPTLEQLRSYSNFLSHSIKNLNLSTQQCYLSAAKLLQATEESRGFFFPAHAFTPYKSLFGSCGASLREIFGYKYGKVKIIELGLSADTQMANILEDLHDITFLSNSDAHSLEKIGREYNIIQMSEPSYDALEKALYKIEGKVVANYGLNPTLGKYYRNYCEDCQKTFTEFTGACPWCFGTNIVKGVYDRLQEIGKPGKNIIAVRRPPYFYQVPLSFLPKIGPKTINKLIDRFGTEMNVLHNANYNDIAETAGMQIADLIVRAREGKLMITPGGGGSYGKIVQGEGSNSGL
ncbi:MAG: endonuclease Q family protein [Bacillota bacterium]